MKHQRILNPGMRGFLLTGSGKEEIFTREAISLFNEHAEKLKNESDSGKTDAVMDDADYELITELSELKNVHNTPFKEAKLGIKHTTFVQCDLSSPSDFILSLLTELRSLGLKKTRYLERVVPVSFVSTCRKEELNRGLGLVLQPVINETKCDQFPSYSIVVKVTNNDVFSKELITEMINDILIGWTPVHEQSDITVMVHVIRGLCCMSVVKQYSHLSRYNVAKVIENCVK